MTTHYNIMGDETTNPDEFVHCIKCGSECPGPEEAHWEESECPKCGASLDSAESLITGHMLRLERERLEKDWNALAGDKP